MDGSKAAGRRDGARPTPSPIDAPRMADEGQPSRSLLERVADDETRAIAAAMAELSQEGHVYRSTTRLDLAIRETALLHNTRTARLARVREVRGAWHRAGGVRIDVGGITLVASRRGGAG